MLEKIAKVAGFKFNPDDTVVMTILNRIAGKMPANTPEDHPAFAAIVRAAEEDVNREGQMAIAALVKTISAPPLEKVLKIKSSPKGARIKVAAANGVRFSFGPIWNVSVTKGKGIALVPGNRAKLNHQALLAGIEGAEEMEVAALCTAIAATF
jgi:ethanolamine utilization microcompartment shell protein EutL